MKFVSKQSNYRVVLTPGLPAEPMTGRSAVAGIYVKFENGIADVKDEKLCESMMRHPAYENDFIILEEGGKDPYNNMRRNKEPEHDVAEVKYGTIGKNLNPKKPTFSREQKEAIEQMSVEIAKKMAPEMAMAMLKEMASNKVEKEKDKTEPKSKKTTKKDSDSKE